MAPEKKPSILSRGDSQVGGVIYNPETQVKIMLRPTKDKDFWDKVSVTFQEDG